LEGEELEGPDWQAWLKMDWDSEADMPEDTCGAAVWIRKRACQGVVVR
jgi:hypothetical protein